LPKTKTSSATANNALARRYAGALFELADEQGHLDAVAGDLRFLAALVRESTEFRHIASHPRLACAERIETMREVATKAKLHVLTRNFLLLVAESGRLAALGAMAEAFLAQFADTRGEMSADVRVAKALTDAQREKLTAQLRQLTSSEKIRLSVTEDPSLLGGMTVKLGSRLIDASVKTKLARLERQLKSQGEAA
jgi:F-type H+-transporting ATPase subunit delta